MTRINTGSQERVLPRECYAELNAFIDDLGLDPEDPRRKDTVIQTLHTAQGIFGFLPEEVQLHIADRYGVTHAEVSGVISWAGPYTR